MRPYHPLTLPANAFGDSVATVSSVVTLSPKDGGLVCQVVSSALTVCRRLPAPVTPLEVLAWVAAGAVLITLWGTLFLYLDERRESRIERGRRREDRGPAVPFIHLPKRSHEDHHEP